jgi:esterase/lipase superfamily enzyme
VSIFIHGLATRCEDEALPDTAKIGQCLYENGYPWLLVGFSWPSYGESESAGAYGPDYQWPPVAMPGTIRGNINGSVDSFISLLNVIGSIQESLLFQGHKLRVNLMCHSEGNYMAMLGMYGYASATQSVTIDQIVLLAADINDGVFVASNSSPNKGQGKWMSQIAEQVTAYYSVNDPDLKEANRVTHLHNTDYPNRLGLSGPVSYSDVLSNVVGVDCSDFVSHHMDYLQQVQILQDLTAVFNHQPPADRTAVSKPNHFTMNVSTSNACWTS